MAVTRKNPNKYRLHEAIAGLLEIEPCLLNIPLSGDLQRVFFDVLFE
jgi:hypothetical protein